MTYEDTKIGATHTLEVWSTYNCVLPSGGNRDMIWDGERFYHPETNTHYHKSGSVPTVTPRYEVEDTT